MFLLSKRSAFIIFLIIELVIFVFALRYISDFKNKQLELSRQIIVQDAKSHFESILAVRLWNASHGGIFILEHDGIKPNPYLDDNYILSKDNQKLIRVNPAWMTRQISEMSNKVGNYYYKITSLKPLNPENEADEFEREALKFFDKYPVERYYYTLSENFEKFDFMGALRTTEECLPCHKQQGYKLNDIRGGIRVSIPTHYYQSNAEDIINKSKTIIIFIIIMAMVVNIIFYWLNSKIFSYQDKLRKINNTLEDKVNQRTRELANLYSHEKYISTLLQAVAKINERLLNSNGFDDAIKNILTIFSSIESYSNLCICFKSGSVSKKIVSNTINSDGELEKSIKEYDDFVKSINGKYVSKTSVSKLYSDKNDIYWQISLPMKTSDSNEPVGSLKITNYLSDGFHAEEIKILENITTEITIFLQSVIQKAEIEKMEIDKINNYEATILAFVNIIEHRDTYTAGHTCRVAKYASAIAKEMGLCMEDIQKLERAAVLHDIGKVATPDSILLKPDALTPIEYELIKMHSDTGYQMLSKIEMYKDLTDIIKYHHVRYDGKGYPETKTVDEAPYLAYILALADSFDAMTTNRIYKNRKTVEEALEEIIKYSGTQFHPDVAVYACSILKNVSVDDITQMPLTDIEKKRMSYFFSDPKTDVFNETYLDIINGTKTSEYKFRYGINLKNFTEYNKTNGWDSGDNLLKNFASELCKHTEDALVFRFEGDDFVILSPIKLELTEDMLNNFESILNTSVSAELIIK